jgi:hypothetical protein
MPGAMSTHHRRSIRLVGAGLAPAHLPPANNDEIENVTSSNIKGQPQGIAPTVDDIVGRTNHWWQMNV